MEIISIINDLTDEVEVLTMKLNEMDGENHLNNKSNLEYILQRIKNIISNCTDILENDIERRLYLELLKGNSPTRAVEKIATENYNNNIKPCSLASIWKYYKKLKTIMERNQ